MKKSHWPRDRLGLEKIVFMLFSKEKRNRIILKLHRIILEKENSPLKLENMDLRICILDRNSQSKCKYIELYRINNSTLTFFKCIIINFNCCLLLINNVTGLAGRHFHGFIISLFIWNSSKYDFVKICIG